MHRRSGPWSNGLAATAYLKGYLKLRTKVVSHLQTRATPPANMPSTLELIYRGGTHFGLSKRTKRNSLAFHVDRLKNAVGASGNRNLADANRKCTRRSCICVCRRRNLHSLSRRRPVQFIALGLLGLGSAGLTPADKVFEWL